MPGVFPSLYVTTWDGGPAEGAATFPKPSKFALEITKASPTPITINGSLDGLADVPLMDKDGLPYQFTQPGVYLVDVPTYKLAPVIPKGYNGSVKVMPI
jgi:hypothetical protein